MSELSTEIYYSSCEVLIETQSNGLLDVSDDVVNVSVSRRMDAISTANISLNNYAGYKTGKYNGVIHIGDRMHIAYFKGNRRIDQFTGRVSKVPVVSFQQPTYEIGCQDCIADLNYIWWDPYSAAAYKEFTFDALKIANDKTSTAYSDSAGGQRLLTFLTDVCGFSKDAVKIAVFPNLPDLLKNIIDIAKANTDQSPDEVAEMLYNMIFGEGTSYSTVGNDLSNPTTSEEVATSNNANRNVLALTNLLGKRSYTSQASCPMNFVLQDGTWGNWKAYSGERHTGKYGLSKKQMKKYAGKNKEAYQCSAEEQDSVIKQVMADIAKGRDNSIANVVWFYIFGSDILISGDGPTANISYAATNTMSMAVGGTSGKDVVDTIGRWYKVLGLKDDGKTFADGSIAKNEVPAPAGSNASKNSSSSKASSATNALASQFGAWCDANRGKWPTTANNGSSHECWNLWNWYYQDFLKLDTNQFQKQPPGAYMSGGNQAFIAQFPQSDYYAKNFQKITSADQVQAGDVCFWKCGVNGNDAYYGHVSIATGKQSNGKIPTFTQSSGTGAPHDYNEGANGLAGALRPTAMGGVAGSYSGGSSGSTGSAVVDQALQAARNETFKLFKFLNLGDVTQVAQAEMYTGKIAMKNDRPALEFVKSLCQATMRSFMSLPDGSFAAFIPDWWGIYQQPGVNNVIEVPAIDVVSFKSDIDKSSYVSHFFLTTAEYVADPSGIAGTQPYLNDLIAGMYSSGTITLQDYAKELAPLMDISATGICEPGKTTADSLHTLMQRWGVNVVTKTDQYISNSTMTTISALTQFLKYWANCYKTSMSLAFRPEIMPGHRLHFPDAHVKLFVESVTHSWSATDGGSTTVSVVAPVTDSGQVGITQQ